ncbi:MAG: HAMP domain-containing histidine kinase [Bryobacteraceae bacterium]|nr:HAMP domain-containing histidine kinase [Bryobacteraceae bacterium]
MGLSAAIDALTQRQTEADPDFAVEVQVYARRGLRIIGYVEIVMTFIAKITQWLGLDYPHGGQTLWWPTFIFLTIGGICLASAHFEATARHSRAIGILMGLVTLVAVMVVDLVATNGLIGDRLMFNVIIVLLVGVATLPMTPLQAVIFNGFAVLCYYFGWELARRAGLQAPADSGIMVLGITAGVCVFVSGGNYERLIDAWKAHREALRVSEELRESGLRICNAENASTNVRLAAALSHELNTPMGALKSSVNTVLTAAERLPRTAPEKQERLIRAMEDARDVANEAIGRLDSVVKRMQRFSNLDRAEVQAIDVSNMLQDIIGLHAPVAGNTIIETRFGSLPALTGQPQALSAVFSTLLRKAIDAAGPEGRVCIRTEHREPWIRVALEHGTTVSQADFDLGFAVTEDRVGAANWDLFSARQVIRAHGGDIEARGASGVMVSLPAQAVVAAATA